MRNLKRALSLALASVMLLGMMVVGTSATTYGDGSQDLPAEIGESACTVQNGASTVLYWNQDYIKSH